MCGARDSVAGPAVFWRLTIFLGVLGVLSSLCLSPRVSASEPPLEDDPAAELMKIRAEQQKAYESINTSNPLSTDFKRLGTDLSAPAGPLGQIQQLLNHPLAKGSIALLSNPVLAKSMDQVLTSPNRMNLLYCEIAFVLFMLIFKTWKVGRAESFKGRLWVHAWTFAVFWIGSLGVIPWAVLGSPYYQTLAGMAQALRSSDSSAANVSRAPSKK